MKYQVSQVQQWGEELDALPAPEPGSRTVGKREAVLLLADKLQSAAGRGVSRAALLGALEAKGLKVHIDLLREALKHVGKTSGQRQTRAPRKSQIAAAAAGDERTEKNRETRGPRNAVGPDRAPGDDGIPAGVSTGAEAGAPSVQSTPPGRTERRREVDEATVIAPVATSERSGANIGSAPASGMGEAPTESREGSKEWQGAVTGVGATGAPGTQATDEVPSKAPAEPLGRRCRRSARRARASPRPAREPIEHRHQPRSLEGHSSREVTATSSERRSEHERQAHLHRRRKQGRVGKSLVSMALNDHLQAAGEKVLLIESELAREATDRPATTRRGSMSDSRDTRFEPRPPMGARGTRNRQESVPRYRQFVLLRTHPEHGLRIERVGAGPSQARTLARAPVVSELAALAERSARDLRFAYVSEPSGFKGRVVECVVAPSGREHAQVVDYRRGHFTLIPKPPDWERVRGRTVELFRDNAQKLLVRLDLGLSL